MTYIYLGHKIDLATFITGGILIGKARSPTDRLLSINNRIETLDQTMMRMHKVLVLDEVQKNTVSAASSDVAVKINGDFCW